MSLIQNSFSKPDQNYSEDNIKKKNSQLQRKNQIIFNNNIDHDWVIIDDNDLILEELKQINKNYNKVKKKYNETKREYQQVMNMSKEQLKLAQEKINNQKKIINNIKYKLAKYDAMNKLKLRFDKIITLVIKNKRLETLYKINSVWNNIITQAIKKDKLSKQYVENVWITLYNKKYQTLDNKLINICSGNEENNIELYKIISELNIFNLDNAIRFIYKL